MSVREVTAIWVVHSDSQKEAVLHLLECFMSPKQKLDALAGKIRTGITELGFHMIHQPNELVCIWNHAQADGEKHMHVENFAKTYGFSVMHLNSDSNLVIFRDGKRD